MRLLGLKHKCGHMLWKTLFFFFNTMLRKIYLSKFQINILYVQLLWKTLNFPQYCKKKKVWVLLDWKYRSHLSWYKDHREHTCSHSFILHFFNVKTPEPMLAAYFYNSIGIDICHLWCSHIWPTLCTHQGRIDPQLSLDGRNRPLAEKKIFLKINKRICCLGMTPLPFSSDLNYWMG